MSKGCENHCSMLKQANETIKRMAEFIDNCDIEEDICSKKAQDILRGIKSCSHTMSCTDCIIKYFEGLED